jgi:hypothetical protein
MKLKDRGTAEEKNNCPELIFNFPPPWLGVGIILEQAA